MWKKLNCHSSEESRAFSGLGSIIDGTGSITESGKGSIVTAQKNQQQSRAFSGQRRTLMLRFPFPSWDSAKESALPCCCGGKDDNVNDPFIISSVIDSFRFGDSYRVSELCFAF